MKNYSFQIYREGLHKDVIYKYKDFAKSNIHSKKEAINEAISMLKEKGSYLGFTFYIVIIDEDEDNTDEFVRYQKDSVFIFKEDKISKANLNMFKDFLN